MYIFQDKYGVSRKIKECQKEGEDEFIIHRETISPYDPEMVTKDFSVVWIFQSPMQMPMSLAVNTLSLSRVTLFLDFMASARGTAFISGVARATI